MRISSPSLVFRTFWRSDVRPVLVHIPSWCRVFIAEYFFADLSLWWTLASPSPIPRLLPLFCICLFYDSYSGPNQQRPTLVPFVAAKEEVIRQVCLQHHVWPTRCFMMLFCVAYVGNLCTLIPKAVYYYGLLTKFRMWSCEKNAVDTSCSQN